MLTWLHELFGTHKPVIAMAHLPPLPGTPRWQPSITIEQMIGSVRTDVDKLYRAGVDAVMFCNEDDRPYTFTAPPEAIAVMTRIVTEVRPVGRVFGVDYLWDPVAALVIARATGAAFMREVVTGVYESDMGLWTPNAAALLRLRKQIGGENIRIFANVMPEFGSPLGSRSIGERARSAVVSSLVDVVLLSGLMAGAEPDIAALQAAKAAIGADVPLLLNTGAKASNIQRYLQVADGVIVGSSLKVDGYTWNPVDYDRAAAFMDVVRGVRAQG
jgi:hypothetical protein